MHGWTIVYGLINFAILAGGLRGKIGGLLLKPVMHSFKNRMNYEEHGGAPLLGVEGAMVKAHGSSSPLAFKNAIRQARLMVEKDVTGTIRAGLDGINNEKTDT